MELTQIEGLQPIGELVCPVVREGRAEGVIPPDPNGAGGRDGLLVELDVPEEERLPDRLHVLAVGLDGGEAGVRGRGFLEGGDHRRVRQALGVGDDIGGGVTGGVQAGAALRPGGGEGAPAAPFAVDGGQLGGDVGEALAEPAEGGAEVGLVERSVEPAGVGERCLPGGVHPHEARGPVPEPEELVGAIPEGDRQELVQARAEVELEAAGARAPEEAGGAVHQLVGAPLGDVRGVVGGEGGVLEEGLVLADVEAAMLPDAVAFVLDGAGHRPVDESPRLPVHRGRPYPYREGDGAETEGGGDGLAEGEPGQGGEPLAIGGGHGAEPLEPGDEPLQLFGFGERREGAPPALEGRQAGDGQGHSSAVAHRSRAGKAGWASAALSGSPGGPARRSRPPPPPAHAAAPGGAWAGW